MAIVAKSPAVRSISPSQGNRNHFRTALPASCIHWVTEESVAQRFVDARRDELVAVLEGFHALKHALRFGARVQAVIATNPADLEKLAEQLAPDLIGEFASRARIVSRADLAAAVPRAPHTEVVAVARRPTFELGDVANDPRPVPVILLEDPRNLSNVGACVRVAAAADVAGVITTGKRDPWHPDAIRGAAGLHYALPVGRVDDLELGDRSLVAVDPDGEPFDPNTLGPRSVLAFGTERHGLSEALLARCDSRVAIPMRSGVSSLNLATSVAAVVFSWRLAAPRVSGAGYASRQADRRSGPS